MKIWSSLAVTVGLCGVVILHLSEQQRHRRDSETLRNEMMSLLRASESERRPACNGVSADPNLERPAAPAPPSSPKDEPEDAEERDPRPALVAPKPVAPEEVRGRLETAFQTQEADPSWARDAESTAREKLTQILQDTSAVRHVECRASMCRFETIVEGREQSNRFFRQAFHDPETKLWNGAVFSTNLSSDADGRVVTVSYLAREGDDLPSITDTL